MGSLLASSADHLLPMASYKMGPTASYVESRQDATFFSSVTSASPEGVRVLTLTVNSASFIDVNSLHFAWTVTNTNADKQLAPLTCGAHCLIQRMIYFRLAG